VDVGDSVLIWGGARGNDEPYALEIVGTVSRRRIAKFQKALALVPLATLQQVNVKQALVTSIDVVLEQGDTEGVRKAVPLIRVEVQKKARNANVTSTEARLTQIRKAQTQQEFVLVLMSSVAMLTALFIILSTLSMGMVERIVQLGLMRCIGLTGLQLATLVLVEVIPLGVLGIAIGIPVGLALTALTVWIVPDYVGTFAVSWNGIGLAIAAGLATIIVAALLPALATLSVSPLEAAHPRARKPRTWRLFLAGGLALVTIGVWYLVVHGAPGPLGPLAAPLYKGLEWMTGLDLGAEGARRSPEFLSFSIMAVVLLYLSYALIAPLLVWVIGTPAVWLVSRLTQVRFRLLQDQVGHAAWRAAGICCGLMVGLSLIVALITFSESFTSSWEFPSKFPEAYIWSFEQMTPDPDEVMAEVNEPVRRVKDYTAANALNVIVEEQPLFMKQVYLSVTWFLGIEPESFLNLVKLEFREGDARTAIDLLKRGGHILIASDFARARNKKVGDPVKVFLGQGQRFHTFTVAGVIDSPALDMAASYFQASSEAKVVAVGSVIGTNADIERFFDIRGTKMILLNFALPPEPPPPGWPPEKGTPAAAGLVEEVYDERLPPDRRWARQREEDVLRDITRGMQAPQAFSGTARELKDEIDLQLTTMTRVLTAVPAVALLVAAVGVANLMTANVTSRVKQLAILRAVGATRGLVLRMVIGEGLVIGVLGSALGLALGLHLAWNVTVMTERMWGLKVSIDMPWGYVTAAVLLTVGLCVLAGIFPARHASRTNVVDALHVA
jgi:ABC-type antimicrobial peptide transport system permease subunit